MAQKLFPLTHKSGVNIKGINSFNPTVAETKERAMESEDYSDEKFSLYTQFWGLQTYLNSPAKVGKPL